MLRPKKNVRNSGEILNGNNLYAKQVSEEFEDIRRFLDRNPSEIVIIDLNGDWFEMDDNLYYGLDEEINYRWVITSYFESSFV